MKVAAPLALAFTLTLIATGCNQTLTTTPTQAPLAPQFGTIGYNSVEHLAVDERGIYLGGQRNSKPALVKFSRTGSVPWTKSLASPGSVVEVALSKAGEVYALYRTGDTHYAVGKYNQAGTLLWTRKFTGPSAADFDFNASDVDAQDNVYLSFSSYRLSQAELRKYSSDGTLLYRKQLSEPVYDLAVTPGGTTYTVSDQLLARYTSQGQQVWQKTLPFVAYKIALGSSSQIYVSGCDPTCDTDRVALAQYSSSGKKGWQRTVRDGFFSNLRALDADKGGNVFVGVEYHKDPYGDQDVYFYSYNAAGKRLVQRRFDFNDNDEVAEIRALSATEVYLGRSTYEDGGDDEEGFLVRLNGLTGTVTWQR